jgi:hypothetical protein
MITKSKISSALFLILIAFSFSSCEAIGDIFKAGMWVGVIIVVAIVALVLWLLNKMRK